MLLLLPAARMPFSDRSRDDVFTVCSVGEAADMVMRGTDRQRISHDLCIWAVQICDV